MNIDNQDIQNQKLRNKSSLESIFPFPPYFSCFLTSIHFNSIYFNLESRSKITTKRHSILFFYCFFSMVDPLLQNQAPIPTPVQTKTPAQTPPVHTPSLQSTRVGSKISIKTFLLGCGIVLLLVMGGLALIFYRLISNPTQLTSLGIDPTTTKTLLQVFSTVFF